MTPEQEKHSKGHLQAIAPNLAYDSDPEAIETLGRIELTVRQQMQKHVSPELGVFLHPNIYRNASRQAQTAQHLKEGRGVTSRRKRW